MVNNKSIVNIKYSGFSLQNGRTPSFSQLYLCLQSPLQSPSKIRSSNSVNFHLPKSPLLVHKIILAIPTNTFFFYTSAILQQLIFCVQPSQQFTPKIFSLFQPFSKFRLRQETRELGSLVKAETSLIFPSKYRQ